MLKKIFPNDQVVGFTANIDPTIAKKEVSGQILLALAGDHSNEGVTFIGSSLGGWLACELGGEFECDVILINPSYDPFYSLSKYEVFTDIRHKYLPMNVSDLSRTTIVIDVFDPVINHNDLIERLRTEFMTHQNSGKLILLSDGKHQLDELHFTQIMKNCVK